MSTITAILEPSADGTLHLPVPEAWKGMSIKVRAEMEPVDATGMTNDRSRPANKYGFGCLNGKIAMGAGFDDPLEDFADYTS